MVRSRKAASRTMRPAIVLAAILRDAAKKPLLRMRASADRDQSTFAAVSCTDSPQPQALTWFGVLKMNWACILSAL